MSRLSLWFIVGALVVTGAGLGLSPSGAEACPPLPTAAVLVTATATPRPTVVCKAACDDPGEGPAIATATPGAVNRRVFLAHIVKGGEVGQ